MSGHSFGAGPDPARHQKTEIKLGLMPNSDIIKQNLQANIHKGGAMSMSSVRPIAPTPAGLTQMAHQMPLQVSATQLLGSSAQQTNIASKIAIGLSGGNPLTGGAGDHSSQLAAVNLANQAMVSQATGGATQIRTLNTQQQQLLQLHPQQQVASNALAQQNVVRLQNSVQVATMSSLIKGAVPLVQSHTGSQQLHQQAGSLSAHQMQQVFPTHLPRGPAAASQLTANKGSGVATAMLRPAQPGGATTLQIPPTSGGTTLVPPASMQQHHIQPRTILPGLRGHAPINARGTDIQGSTGAAVQMHQGHGDGHKGVPTSMPSIQISVQQRNRVEVHTRPVSQLQQGKPVTVTQQHTQGSGVSSQTAQKVLMSSQGPVNPNMLQQSGGMHTPLTLPAGQKIVGQMMSPMIRQSKIITSQPSNIAGHNAGYALSGGNRPSKIIVTQAGSGGPQNLPTGTIITTVAKTSTLGQSLPRPQQKVLSHPVNTIATTTTVASLAHKGVKLPQHRQIQQPHSLSAAAAHLQSQQQQQHSPHLLGQQVGAAVGSAVTSQALAAHLEQATRVSAATHQSNTHPGLVQTSTGQQQVVSNAAAAAASMFLAQQQQKTGGSSSGSLMMPGGISSTTSNTSSVDTVTGSRESSQERVMHHPLPFNIPANMASLAQYYQSNPTMANLYQQAVLQGAKKGQTQNLTANLQGSSHGAAVTVSQGAAQSQHLHSGAPVRINNTNMIPVTDPTRHVTTVQQNSQAMCNMAELIASSQIASSQATQHNFKYAVNKGGESNLVATMASSHLNTAVAMGASHMNAGQQPAANQNTGSTTIPSNSNLTSSPRPSILRKRNNEGNITVVKRQILGGPMSSPSSTTPQSLPLSSLENNIITSSSLYHHNTPPPLLQPPSSEQHYQHQAPVYQHPHAAAIAALSPKPVPLELANENSQSSTDTASSTHSTPQSRPPASHLPSTIDSLLANAASLENGHLSSVLQNNNEASPRKKPRKQLLHVNTEHGEHIKAGHDSGGGGTVIPADTDHDEEIEKFSKKVHTSRLLEQQKQQEEEEQEKQAELTEFVDEEGVRWVRDRKRPPIALLHHYQCSWKPKNNHFLRHSDVKPKDERRPTVNELSNQKHVVQKSSGWKMYHLAAQIEELMDSEKVVLDKMISVQDQVAPKHIAKTTMEDDIGMVHELSQGNIQRCQLFADQMQEAKTAMLKILDHKKRITEIINKHHSKRPVKKKERS